MIADAMELKVTRRQLKIMEIALKSLRRQLVIANPELLAITAKAYIRWIEDLQEDLHHYLSDPPVK